MKHCFRIFAVVYASTLTHMMCFADVPTWLIGTPDTTSITARLENTTLTISGTGAMQNWHDEDKVPWKDIRSDYLTTGGIKAIVVKPGVTTIGKYAFACSFFLTSVELSDNVTEIGESAFYHCKFTNINIPPNIKNLSGSVFSGCSKLSEVSIPMGVTNIGNLAFAYCRSLTNVVIQSGVRSIQDCAFVGCDLLEKIILPNTIEYIGTAVFTGCDSLQHVVLPQNIDKIRDGLFEDCYNLQSVNIPKTVTSIGHTSFKGCTSLTSVTIPSSVAYIGYSAFDACTSLRSVDFEGAPPTMSFQDRIAFPLDIKLRYNIAYKELWDEAIETLGYTNTEPYTPIVDPDKPKIVDGRITVNFIALGGDASVPSFEYPTNGVYGVLPDANRAGCVFAGWYTSMDGGVRISAFSNVNERVGSMFARWVDSNKTLFAQWQPNSYSVEFNPNGGTGTMDSQPMLYDQLKCLTKNTYRRKGYVFTGWSTNVNGNVTFCDGECVSNLTDQAGWAIALFANWREGMELPGTEIASWIENTIAPKFKGGDSSTEYLAKFQARFGTDYVSAFQQETGKIGMDGKPLCVWHDYVAGTDPMDAGSKFSATVNIENGVVKIDYSPKFEDQSEADMRIYRKWGKTSLKDDKWVEVPSGKESNYNFFKVTVEMK